MSILVEHSVDELRELKDRKDSAFQRIIGDFERELVTQISELGTHVDQAIYVMAHVHKRFNKTLLETVDPDADTGELLEKIRALPFVKAIEEDYLSYTMKSSV